ncbi:MAG: ACT domain-containing protein [Terracidiphilus sp.]
MSDSAVLLIDCPDRKGLVARVSGLLYEHGANILHADQHQDHDLGLFFMRVEFTVNGGDESAAMEPAEPQNIFPIDQCLMRDLGFPDENRPSTGHFASRGRWMFSIWRP